MIVHVSYGFAELPDAELDAFTENVVASMTGNPGFSTPVPPLIDVSSRLGVFKDALAKAASGGKSATAAKNQAREALLTQRQ